MKIANIRHFHQRYSYMDRLSDLDSRPRQLKRVVALAAREGFAFGNDGRAYVPEARRGAGVGYGQHGRK